MRNQEITPLWRVREGRGCYFRAALAGLIALLPFPICSFMVLAHDYLVTPNWAAMLVSISENLFPGLAQMAHQIGDVEADPLHLFILAASICAWCFFAALAVSIGAYLSSPGLATENLRRSAAAGLPAMSGRRFHLGRLALLFFLLLTGLTAVDALFGSGTFFANARQTCAQSIGLGRDQHCLAHEFLPLAEAVWKLGWTTSIANLLLLVLLYSNWFAWVVVRKI